MPHVTMEYVIMVPILLMQVLLLPLATSWMMTAWADHRMQIALQDAVNHLGSTIQQLYFSLNRREVLAGTVNQSSNVPPTIESNSYNVTGVLSAVSGSNSSMLLALTAVLYGTKIMATMSITLGPNVLWRNSTFVSNSVNACIKVEKSYNATFPDGAFIFSFG